MANAGSPSLKDGLWTDTGVFAAGASAPSSTIGAIINHRVVVPPNVTSATGVACKTLALGSANGIRGELIAGGPNAFITVGTAQPMKLGTMGSMERDATGSLTNNIPIGTVG